METTKTMPGKSVLLQLAEKLTAAQRELDELAVQLALGKSEAADKFEEIKKDFSTRIRDLKNILESAARQETEAELKGATTSLMEELLPNKATTKEQFEAQKVKIMSAIRRVENFIKDGIANRPEMYDVIHELEKFKMKLEILRLRFVLKKFEIRDAFKDGMKQATGHIDQLIAHAVLKRKETSEKFEDFGEEIRAAYGHIKNAVNKI